jgi:ABC-type transport system involved in cytochrome bd biosynthesis fused ATPase/permease subunit
MTVKIDFLSLAFTFINIILYLLPFTILIKKSNMDSKNKKHIVLCGRSGDGKSSIANMLIQGDIYRDRETYFKIG